MPEITPERVRLPFYTQRPSDDGCGGAVLQMLTGLPEAEIAAVIGWRDGAVRHSAWTDLIRVLTHIGWTVGAPLACTRWDAIPGLAIVHVRDDHFMLYDADNALFYDPGEWQGPSATTSRIPMSYLPVTPLATGQYRSA